MVEVNLIPTKLFHITITTYLHFTCIHSLILPWFSTHLTFPFIKTSNSCLFHITKICTSKYIVRNSRNKITIHFIILWYYSKFTQHFEHRNHYSLYFFIVLKTPLGLHHSFMFYSNKIQSNKMNIWYIKTESMVFYYKVRTTLILPQNCVSKIPFFFPRTFPFG
jgi:hypothetical protein